MSSAPSGTRTPSEDSMRAAMRSAICTPRRWMPTSTSPSVPSLRSRISSAMRVTVRSRARALRTIDDELGMSSGKYGSRAARNEAAGSAFGVPAAQPSRRRATLQSCVPMPRTATFPRMTDPHLTLVVPCYNGEDRLPAPPAHLSAFLALQPYSSELVLVDDCSAAPAARVLREYAASRPGITLLRT